MSYLVYNFQVIWFSMIFKLTVTRIKWFISFPRIDLKSVQQIKILKRIAKIEHSRSLLKLFYTLFFWNLKRGIEIEI